MKILGNIITGFVYGAVLIGFYSFLGFEVAILVSIAFLLVSLSEFLSDFKDYTREQRTRQLEMEESEIELNLYKKHFGDNDE